MLIADVTIILQYYFFTLFAVFLINTKQ